MRKRYELLNEPINLKLAKLAWAQQLARNKEESQQLIYMFNPYVSILLQ